MNLDFPPENWTQKIRRGLPFAPAIDDQELAWVKSRAPGYDWLEFRINVQTGEVFAYNDDNGTWDQPPWFELPLFVRALVHDRTHLTSKYAIE